MQIIYKKIEELKPYKNNPRKNDEAVPYVAESIKQFGFKVPIIKFLPPISRLSKLSCTC